MITWNGSVFLKKIKNKKFVKLLIANCISRVGDSIDMLAFSWLIYAMTNSVAWSAIIVGINQGTSIIFQPLVGAIVERFPKKKTMIISDYCRFFLIILLFSLYKLGCCNGIVLVLFTVFVSLVETFRIPAGFSFLPQILEPDEYEKCLSTNNGFCKLCEFVGLMFAGILIKFTGSITAILFDGFTFLISAILIQLIETEDVANNNQDNGIMAELIDGLKLLLQNKELFTICLVCMIINAIVIPYDTLLPAIIDTYYNTEPFILTVFNVIFSVGLIVGSFLCGLKKKKEDNMIGILSVGGVLIGLFYFAFAIISNLSINNVIKCIYMAIPLFIVSCAIAVMNTSVQVFFVKYVKKDYLARISAISTTVTMIGAPITAFALAIVSEVLKISEILVGTGIITVLVFCCLGYSLYKVRYANDKF